jgi:hypothetical protein
MFRVNHESVCLVVRGSACDSDISLFHVEPSRGGELVHSTNQLNTAEAVDLPGRRGRLKQAFHVELSPLECPTDYWGIRSRSRS